MDGQSLWEQVDQLLSAKRFDEAERLLMEKGDIAKQNNQFLQLYYLVPICAQEREAGQQTLFSKVSGLKELLERHTRVKFYIRRIAFGLLEDEEEFCSFCVQNRVSVPELLIETYLHAIHVKKVQTFLQEKIREGKFQI